MFWAELDSVADRVLSKQLFIFVDADGTIGVQTGKEECKMARACGRNP